jgi:hypothetical protein
MSFIDMGSIGRPPDQTPDKEPPMRNLLFVAILFALAAAGLYSISFSVAAARDARPATFSERFAPVLQTPSAARQ